MAQMTADESRRYAQTIVLPPLLDLIGLHGRLTPIERPWRDRHRADPIVRALDTVGGVDFWVGNPADLVALASRVQWHNDDTRNCSHTVRVDIGGHPTEADKRVAAIQRGGILPEWTAQGYVTHDGALHHAGIIRTRELYTAFLQATASGQRKDWRNPDDGHWFWAAFWATLRKHGNAETLTTIDPPAKPRQLSAIALAAMLGARDPRCDCVYPHRHRDAWSPHPDTGRQVCQICHPVPA